MQIVKAVRQNHWRRPAVINLWLGGAGTGYYLFSFMSSLLDNATFDFWISAATGVLSVMLVGLGFLILSIELGRPLRSVFLLRNIYKASMAHEALGAIVFLCAVIMGILTGRPVFQIAAALGALTVLVSQGFIVYRERGIPFWNTPEMPLFFVVSGLFSGYGIYSMANGQHLASLTDPAFFLGGICVVINMIAWLMVLRRARYVEDGAVRQCIGHSLMQGLVFGMGHIFPLLVIVAGWLVNQTVAVLPSILFFSAGCCCWIIAGLQKSLVLRSGGFTSGIQR